jgi:hypothetical protein
MFRTLSELRDSINRMIDEQGEDAPCASFVFTKKDVFYYGGVDDDGLPNLDVEQYLNDEDTEEVLNEVGNNDYIYEQIGEFIDDEVRRIRNRVTVA